LKSKVIAITLALCLTGTIFASLEEDMQFIIKLYEDGEYNVALREIQKIEPSLNQNPYSNQLRLIQGDIFIKQGDYSAAHVILQRLDAQSLSPTLQAQVLLSLAKLEKQQNNLSGSKEYLQQYIRRFPDEPQTDEAYGLLGEIYIAQGDYDAAEAVFTDLNQKQPSAVTMLNLVKLHTSTGRLEVAQALLQQMKTRYPSAHTEYQNGLLLLLTAYENHAQFQQIITLCPDSFDAKTSFSEANILKKISAYIQLKQFDTATALLTQIKDDPRQVSYYRALIHKEKGEDQLALPIFRILVASDANPQLKAMSTFQMVQITAKTDPVSATSQLQDFLIKNPDQPWEGDIMYQLAFLENKQRNYERAYSHVNSALNLNLSPANKQNALYLKGDLEFLRKDYATARQTFNQNKANMPTQFADEVLFKQGAIQYFLLQPDSAKVYFNRVISDYPSSQKVGASYYHLGEIELYRNQAQARSYYQQALSGDMDRGVVYLRLAYVEQLRADYPAALERLNSVPETSDYLYDKYLLKGNILFAQKKYIEALEAYRVAERNSKDKSEAEYVLSRQAWTYYSLQQYDTATQIYRRLAEQSDAPGQYLLSAAGSAFNADNFEDSATLYNDYIRAYPTSPERYRAMLGLANCYYNLSNIEFAINLWRELVHQDRTQAIVEASLRGLQAGYQKLGQMPLFTEFLNLQIMNSSKDSFITQLYEYKINFEYEQKNYTASVNTLNQLFSRYPAKKDDQRLMIMLANNYTWLTQYEEADQIYVELSYKYSNDPQIFYEWANIKWAQRDYPAAIRRYKEAADKGQNEQYWLVLLERQLEVKDSEFMKYYNTFTQFALNKTDYNRTTAKVFLIDWQIHEKNYNAALQSIEEVLETSHNGLRANATFKRGEVRYAQKNYDDALTDFLRIRYVFNEFSDLRYRAELYIAKIYLLQGNNERAQSLFDNIRQYLSDEQIAEYNGMKG